MRDPVIWRSKGFWCLRLFGWQFDITNHRKRPPYFSERYSGKHGIPRHRRLHVGPYCLRFGRVG